MKVFDDIFLTHQGVYTASTLEKDKPNHDPPKCEECISMESPALGEADIIIPPFKMN